MNVKRFGIGALVLGLAVFTMVLLFVIIPSTLGYLANEGVVEGEPPAPEAVKERTLGLEVFSPLDGQTIPEGEQGFLVHVIDPEGKITNVTVKVGETTPVAMTFNNTAWEATILLTPGDYAAVFEATGGELRLSQRITFTVVEDASRRPEPPVAKKEKAEPKAPPAPVAPEDTTAAPVDRKVIGTTVEIPGIGRLFVTEERAYVIEGDGELDVACLAQVGGSMAPVRLRGEGCAGFVAHCLPLPAGVVKSDGKARTCGSSGKPKATASAKAPPPGTICYVNGEPKTVQKDCDEARDGAFETQAKNGMPNYKVGP